MYYFLAHRLWDASIPVRRKQRIADNTFLLALDGDVDFEPLAVTLLVDLMKRNLKVGAACGRIHPIGSGDDIIVDRKAFNSRPRTNFKLDVTDLLNVRRIPPISSIIATIEHR